MDADHPPTDLAVGHCGVVQQEDPAKQVRASA